MRSFLLVKTKPGKEIDVLSQLKPLSEVREIHVVTGEFDLLVCLDTEEADLDPRRRVLELLVERVSKLSDITLVDTVIPVDSLSRPPVPSERPLRKAFVFVKSERGKEEELMHKLLDIPEVIQVYLLFGRADLLAELEVEKSLIHPSPRHIADVVEEKIQRLREVLDTSTYVPVESTIK